MDSVTLQIPTPVQWAEDGLAVALLDQTLLPEEERVLRLETVAEVAEAISALRVRGAPAIGLAAAFGLALGARRRWDGCEGCDPERPASAALSEGVRRDFQELLGTRPTAVNLRWALERVYGAFRSQAHQGAARQIQAAAEEAERIAREDRDMCRSIGQHGLALIPEEGVGVLTHCNAGALATGGIGTALAPLYTAHARGIPLQVYADETRPLLQGARLTAWELQKAGIPVTVITDSMAGALMREGRVGMVMVGADRVAANGDVANKIGTYGLAVLANHHGIPFYVALPRSTFDHSAGDGRAIPIEERPPAEVGQVLDRRSVPHGVEVWNPAFDITPQHLITAFITDGGVIGPPFRASIARFSQDPSAEENAP